MKEDKFEIQAVDFISGSMTEDEARRFEKFLDENPRYQEKFNDLQDAWGMMEEIDSPKPSEKMDEAFFEMLSNEMDKQRSKSSKSGLLSWFPIIFKPQLAYGIFLLALGLGIGYVLAPTTASGPTEVLVANHETEEVRQKLVLTLLEQPSANQRLQGVSEANKFENADEIVIKALLQTLNSDSNVNVRLAAIESLTNYVDNPTVRQGLVQSIPNQESPLLQITLANLMVALQEKASIEPFKQLLQEKQLDTTVKKRIEKSIQSII
ncbi:MAG: HEAT repeat domain-containing protein [Muricauda sp.]|nr:HEAT repeat domain-containing protein [Allomuricauda sp.]